MWFGLFCLQPIMDWAGLGLWIGGYGSVACVCQRTDSIPVINFGVSGCSNWLQSVVSRSWHVRHRQQCLPVWAHILRIPVSVQRYVTYLTSLQSGRYLPGGRRFDLLRKMPDPPHVLHVRFGGRFTWVYHTIDVCQP